jgi:hypothetical protein
VENNPYRPEISGLALTRALAEALGWYDLEVKEGWYETPDNGDFEADLYGTNPEGERNRFFGRCGSDVLDALRVCRQFCASYHFVLELEWYEDDYPYHRTQAAFRDLWGSNVLEYVTNSFSATRDYNPDADAITRLMLRVLEMPEYAPYRERTAL